MKSEMKQGLGTGSVGSQKSGNVYTGLRQEQALGPLFPVPLPPHPIALVPSSVNKP